MQYVVSLEGNIDRVVGIAGKDNANFFFDRNLELSGANAGQYRANPPLWQSLTKFGSGEIFNFDFHIGFSNEVPLCFEVTMDCGDGNMRIETFCEAVDLLCW